MGIGKLIEEAAGAVAAEQALEAVDPNAGLLTKGLAAVAGFEGVNKLSGALEAHAKPKAEDAIPPDPTLDPNSAANPNS